MDQAGVLASLCFPTHHPVLRAAVHGGQRPRVRLRAACSTTTTGWSRSGAAPRPGRYIPLMLIPMWDPPLAAKEMERMAAKGVTAFAFSENTAPARAADHPRRRPLLGPGHGGGQRPRDGRVHARRLVVAAAPDRTRRAVHGQPHLGRVPHVGHHAGVAVQRHVPALPEPQDRAVRGRDRLDPLLPRAGRAGARQAALLGDRGRRPSTTTPAPTSTSTRSTSAATTPTTSSGASSTTTTASPASPRSARTTSCARPTTRTRTRPGRTRIEVVQKQIAHLTPEQQYKILRGNAERLYRFTPAEPPAVTRR